MLADFCPQVRMAADASGAYQAGKAKDVVVIVDVIDMSTTLECAMENGCLGIYGAASDHVKAPVPTNPENIGFIAGKESVLKLVPIIVVAEPRWGTEKELKKNARRLVSGIEKAGGLIEKFIPNLGLSTVKLCDFQNKLVVAVTESGGTAFDAALNAGGFVLTGTIARTYRKKGIYPALSVAQRAVDAARLQKRNISVIAASANSLEDVLGAQYITQKILELLRT